MSTPPQQPSQPEQQQPHSPIPTASNAEDVRDAISFARQLAQDELNQIDRIHQRTVRYILAVVAVFLAGGTIVGWIGFKNLEDSALNTATKQLQDETSKQVQQKLTTEGLNNIVSTQVSQFVNQQLTAEVNKQIVAGPLHDQILNTAREQSQREISSALAPRRLTEQQAASLKRAFSQDKDLQGRLFFSNALTYDVESENYEEEIDAALKAAGAQFGYRNNLSTPDHPFSYGVTIVYDDYLETEIPKRLLNIFEVAGIKTTLVAGKKLDSEGETIKPVFTIWIGPRDFTQHSK